MPLPLHSPSDITDFCIIIFVHACIFSPLSPVMIPIALKVMTMDLSYLYHFLTSMSHYTYHFSMQCMDGFFGFHSIVMWSCVNVCACAT